MKKSDSVYTAEKNTADRKDRDVEDRAPRDGAIVLVLEQLVEKEQAEEERGVGDRAARRSGGCRRARPRTRIEQRIERKERHVRALVALASRCRCSARRPTAPRRRAARDVDSWTCVPARWPMMTAASSAMTMMAMRVATKSISTSRTVWLKRAAMSTLTTQKSVAANKKRRAPCVSCGGSTNVSHSSKERQPRSARRSAASAASVIPGAARKVARVADPRGQRQRRRRARCRRAAADLGERRAWRRDDHRVPCEEPEREAAQTRRRDTPAAQPEPSNSPKASGRECATVARAAYRRSTATLVLNRK